MNIIRHNQFSLSYYLISEMVEYVKSSDEGACCVSATEQHEGCFIHSSTTMVSDESCKRACNNDPYCKGYTIMDSNGEMTCRLATTVSQCPHNWEPLSGVNSQLDPSAVCESSYFGCYIKQNGKYSNIFCLVILL